MNTPKPTNGTDPPTTSLAAQDRWELLVNNELFADVVFSVGTEGTLMYGHKAVLTMASDVFRAQFTGSFRESRENSQEHEILVIDIEPPVFKEILRYAYCDKVSITADNVLHLLYAAEKYLLVKLTKECTEYVEEHLSEENVLKIFVQNRSYDLEDINRKCLDIICLNPIRMFMDEDFLTLDSKSLELIAGCTRMNCQLNQLVGAIDAWLKINEHDAKRGNEIRDEVLNRSKLDHLCKNIQNFSSGRYRVDIVSEMIIETDSKTRKQFYVYGIGIPFKLKHFLIEPQNVRVDLSVTSVLRKVKVVLLPMITKRFTVLVDTFVHTEEVMFERQKIDKDTVLKIKIHISNADWPMYCMDKFTSDHPEVDLRFRDCGSNDDVSSNCVAYLLYDEGKDKPLDIAEETLKEKLYLFKQKSKR